MRTGLIALLLLGLAGAAGAQSQPDTSDLPRPSIGLPLPHIGLPLPSIGLPLPPMGLSPQQRKPTILGGPAETRAPHVRDRASRRSGGAVFLFAPAFEWPYLPGTPVPSLPSPPPQERPATGRLRIDLQTGVDPQIFVDGYFVGSMSDLNGEVTLDTGHHTIELREDGYETLHLDVQVLRDSVATYRGVLKPIARASSAAVTAPEPVVAPPLPPPTTIYVIRGCYVGNVPPKDATLPAGCDERDAVAFPSRP